MKLNKIARIEVDIPIYGEWVNRAGCQDRSYKGDRQPVTIEAPLFYVEGAGVGYLYKGMYIFRNIADRSLRTIEKMVAGMSYPKWDIDDFDI